MTDPDDHGELVLVFTAGGQAVLEEDGDVVWSSDDDEDFQEELMIDFLSEGDTIAVLHYLIDNDYIEEAESPDVAIEIESYDADDLPALSRQSSKPS
jgi:hypothetical protein